MTNIEAAVMQKLKAKGSRGGVVDVRATVNSIQKIVELALAENGLDCSVSCNFTMADIKVTDEINEPDQLPEVSNFDLSARTTGILVIYEFS